MEAYGVINSEKVFEGRIINVYCDTLMMPDGKEAKREVIRRGGAAAVIPVDEDGNIIFVRQYRHPAGRKVLEIPAGMNEGDEDSLVCAKRELEEETGYKSEKLSLITAMYPTIGFCDEIIHIYVATDLSKGKQNFDPDEFIEVEKYDVETAIKMIFNGEIVDSKTIIAILALKEMKY